MRGSLWSQLPPVPYTNHFARFTSPLSNVLTWRPTPKSTLCYRFTPTSMPHLPPVPMVKVPSSRVSVNVHGVDNAHDTANGLGRHAV